MKTFLALALLCGVAMGMPAEPEIIVRAPSTFQNCDCQCDSYTWSSKGRVIGNCLSPDATGANFCYVSGIAAKACRDVQISESRADSFSNRGKFYSYEACSTPPRNKCFNTGGPGTNLGEGDRPVRPGGFGGRPVGPPPPIGGPGGYSGKPTNLQSILGVRSGGGDAAPKA